MHSLSLRKVSYWPWKDGQDHQNLMPKRINHENASTQLKSNWRPVIHKKKGQVSRWYQHHACRHQLTKQQGSVVSRGKHINNKATDFYRRVTMCVVLFSSTKLVLVANPLQSITKTGLTETYVISHSAISLGVHPFHDCTINTIIKIFNSTNAAHEMRSFIAGKLTLSDNNSTLLHVQCTQYLCHCWGLLQVDANLSYAPILPGL